MKRIAIPCVLSIVLISAHGDGESWQRSPPEDLKPGAGDRELSRSLYAEVSGPQFKDAEGLLEANAVVHLSNLQMNALTGHALSCPEKFDPYLVRAVYENRGTGTFSVYEYEGKSAIVVWHGSLGRPGKVYRTAFVVCSVAGPREAYNVLSGAL